MFWQNLIENLGQIKQIASEFEIFFGFGEVVDYFGLGNGVEGLAVVENEFDQIEKLQMRGTAAFEAAHAASNSFDFTQVGGKNSYYFVGFAKVAPTQNETRSFKVAH